MNSIYHFCQDEKFINRAYDQFEKLYPGQNKFLVYSSAPHSIKHIKMTDDFEIISDLKMEMQNVPANSIAIFHSLPNHILNYLYLLHQSIKTVWFCFGFEVYNDGNLYSENKILDKITKMRFGTFPASFKERLYEKTLPLQRIIKPDVGYSVKEEKLNKLRRIDYLGCSFDEEYKKIKKLTKISVPLFNFWYYPLEKILDVDLPIQLVKTKILIGNSGFKSNNHLDILDKLIKLEVKKEDFIIPLSYGNTNYIDFIKESFILPKNKVAFLEDFLIIENYNTLLSETKIGIFNTRRQQAIGNIIALIYHGATVFISEKNTFYHFLKRNEILVYSYEKDLDKNFVKKSLKFEDIEGNRKKLFALLNEEKILYELKLSVDKIIN